MKPAHAVGGLLACALFAVASPAFAFGERLGLGNPAAKASAALAGQLLDFTNNGRTDCRVWSAALGEKRDVYVYLPPGYDGRTRYPVMLWLNGIVNDERQFLDFLPAFDDAIRRGVLPPLVVVAPDGSVNGRPQALVPGSFYLNSKAGRFEDYIVDDVWPWALATFAVRPERAAHVVAGFSMGGYGAYTLAFKHKEQFALVGGLLPPLDLLYAGARGKYRADYDPATVTTRETVRRRAVIARYYGLAVRQRLLLNPLVGRRGPVPVDFIRENNPVEMIASRGVRPGEFGLFVGYVVKDQFNIDAQVEHFADVAEAGGLGITVVRSDRGTHNPADAARLVPAFAAWLAPRLAPYSPAACPPPTLRER